MSSSEKGLDYSSRHDLVAILVEKGKFDTLGRYLVSPFGKDPIIPQRQEWALNSLEKGI